MFDHMFESFVTLPPRKVDRPRSMSSVSLPFGHVISPIESVEGCGIFWKFIPRVSIRRGALGCFSWNSALLSGRMLSSGSHVQSARFGYPSHFTRYFNFPLESFESMTSSTTYSSPSSVMIGGGGGGFFCEGYSAGMKGERYFSLKVAWTFFQVAGSLSR